MLRHNFKRFKQLFNVHKQYKGIEILLNKISFYFALLIFHKFAYCHKIIHATYILRCYIA